MNGKKRENYLFLAILCVSLFLRVWGINFGLPYLLHSDEPIIINHAVAYGTGDLNPHFFTVPPFCSYLVFICYGAYFMLGKLAGFFADAQAFAFHFVTSPSSFYLVARIVLGVIPGVLIVWLVFLLYRKLFSGKGSLYSACLIAFSFLPVVNSHYAYVDNMTVVFILASYIFMVRMIERPILRNYVLSGLFLGLAVGSKYNAGLLVAPFFIAHATIVFNEKGGIGKLFLDRRLFLALIAIFASFILTNPFSVLDLRFFLSCVPGKIRSAYIGWTHHIFYSMHEAFGWGVLIAALAGAVSILLKEKLSKSLFLFSFPILFYLHLVIGSQRFSRYVLPLLPFIAIAAAYLFFEIMLPKARGRFQRVFVIILAMGLVAPTAIKSIKADTLFCSKDTRVLAARWIEENIPLSAKIAFDHPAFRPPVSQSREQIMEKYKMVDSEKNLAGLKEKKLGFTLRALEGKKTYNVYFLARPDKKLQFLFSEPRISRDMTSLDKEGIEYVTINYNDYNEFKEKLIKDLEANGAKVAASFSPYYDNTIRPAHDSVDLTFMNIDSRELFSRRNTGPLVVIYKLRAK